MGQQYVGQLSQGYGIPHQSYRQQPQQLPTSTVAPTTTTSNLAAFPATGLSAAPIVGAVATVAASTASTDQSSKILPSQNAQPKRERRVLKIINPETQECLNENDVASSETTISETSNETFTESISKFFDIKCIFFLLIFKIFFLSGK